MESRTKKDPLGFGKTKGVSYEGPGSMSGPHEGRYIMILRHKLFKARTSNIHGFLPQEFLAFALPARRTQERVWTRTNGKYTFTVTAGAVKDFDGSLVTELPSGKYARAALLYLCTQAKLTSDARISINDSYRSFIHSLGLTWQGAQRGKEALHQLMLVAAATFTVIEQYVDETTGEEHYSDTGSRISDTMDLWTIHGREDISHGTRSTVTLSPMMVEMLDRAAPLSMQSWCWLLNNTKSPMALDVYSWLCGRLYRCNGPSRVSWQQLYEQFGSTAPLKRFKQHFRSALETAQRVYPEAHITEDFGLSRIKGFKGYHLRPSPDPRDSQLPS